MNTNTAAASVIGARHQRAGRNGQDAAVVVTGEDVAIAVVCDGCSSGASSEVGARLGAMVFAQKLRARLEAGECVRERSVWEATRAEVASLLAAAIGTNKIIDAQDVHDHLLFTIVAAAITHEGAAIWALGDGAYAVDARTCVLGPFTNNEPPYLAYDLLGTAATAHFEVFDRATRIVVATDGIEDLERDFGVFAAPEFVAHPDGLRRRLSQLARGDDRIDWREQRVVRTPALLQDDLAIAILEVL
ncbi:MAG TPA: protein phosphatase 2C domain-containing protein [Kofleriaceae bacterium]